MQNKTLLCKQKNKIPWDLRTSYNTRTFLATDLIDTMRKSVAKSVKPNAMIYMVFPAQAKDTV